MNEIDVMEQQAPTLVFGEVEDAVKDKQPLAEIPQVKEMKEIGRASCRERVF